MNGCPSMLGMFEVGQHHEGAAFVLPLVPRSISTLQCRPSARVDRVGDLGFVKERSTTLESPSSSSTSQNLTGALFRSCAFVAMESLMFGQVKWKRASPALVMCP